MAQAQAPASGRRPNLVFFMPDELRAESLACYGHPVARTPNFDRLASEGVRFEQCHVQNPVCGPSRCSLMTGWPVHVRGHRSLYYDLHPDVRTLEAKLIYRPDAQSELYDLAKDPRELHNVYGDGAYSSLQAGLERRMLDWYVRTSDVAPRETDPRGLPPGQSR